MVSTQQCSKMLQLSTHDEMLILDLQVRLLELMVGLEYGRSLQVVSMLFDEISRLLHELFVIGLQCLTKISLLMLLLWLY